MRLPLFLATTVFVATVPVVAAAPASAAPASPVSLADWQGPGWGGGYAPQSQQYTQSQQGTVVSDPATPAESRGVVLINTQLDYAGASGAGTGLVLTSSGEVLTNYHVVEGATEVTVTVASTGQSYAATVVGHDATSDIAVLQLTHASGLQTVTLDDDTLATGDAVTAVGNAGGTGSLTAAQGTVTSLTATVTTAAEGTVGSETLTRMIETSADVVAGDSGGPLLDAEGEVVGIDTAASTGRQIDGYAIPIDTAMHVVDQIVAGKSSSTVQIGASAFLGVQVADTSYSGAGVVGVVDGGPAAKAGLSDGDVITRIGTTTVRSAGDVTTAVRAHRPGDAVRITWLDASGTRHSATVTLGSSPVA